MTIVFVNTRAQAELMFQALWRLNDDNLPIALHHGSLAVGAAPQGRGGDGAGRLRAVVGHLVARPRHRLGRRRPGDPGRRAQGRLAACCSGSAAPTTAWTSPSRAILVPANRFEVLECEAAIEAVAAHELDGDPPRPGGLDVLAQHILAMACAAPFRPDELYAEVTRAAPYAGLSRQDFDDVAELRRGRRLRARHLRALAPAVPRRRGLCAICATGGRAAATG